MDYKTIIVDQRGHVAMITLNRPEQMNTFSTELAVELNDALVELEEDRKVRVVVIKGKGAAFCAGADVSEFFGKSSKEYREWTDLMEKMSINIANMKKPVIASAHGFCVANGAGLIAACDLAIVSEDAKIGTTAINIGLFCMGPAVPMSKSLGRKRCLQLLLTGDMIDAADAERYGMVNWVVPRDKLEDATTKLANKLAAKSPLALQMGKQAFYGMSDMEFGKAHAYANELFSALCLTDDAQEGVKAFLEKRKPEWKER